MRLALILLAGCNQIFGLEHVQRSPDFFDATPDTPFACPASGVPAFKSGLHQVSPMPCHSYTTSAMLGAGACPGATGDACNVAAVDTDPAAATATTVVLASGTTASTMLAPEGDQLYLTYYVVGLTLVSYSFKNGSWTKDSGPTLPAAFDNNDRFSRPSARPRRALWYHAVDTTWHELAETAAGSWTEVRTHPELAADATDPRLSDDGLRFTASSYSASGTGGFAGPVYASRATVDDAFTPLAPIVGIPPSAIAPFFSDDCGKLYFSDGGALYYAQRM